jgi:hypothetical protein
MTWVRRLLRLVGGHPDRATVDDEAGIRAGFLNRSRTLEEHAALAPNEFAAEELRALAREERAMADRLGAALGVFYTPAGAEAQSEAGSSHWARLLYDLEQHRTSRQRLREMGIRLARTRPVLSGLCHELARDEELHGERLRNLIARADPQALN